MAIDFNKDGDFDDAGETLFLRAIACDTQAYSEVFIFTITNSLKMKIPEIMQKTRKIKIFRIGI